AAVPEATRATDMASAEAAPKNLELAVIGFPNLRFFLSPGRISQKCTYRYNRNSRFFYTSKRHG
ncbi:hypothetical protein, partial [Brucella grignonensis]|uniref:hypothetical protein n=1 Tax=Brucella grignonensis TaxID=94627 RepID=UPI001ABFED39